MILISRMTDGPLGQTDESMCPRCYRVKSRCRCAVYAEHQRNYNAARTALIDTAEKCWQRANGETKR